MRIGFHCTVILLQVVAHGFLCIKEIASQAIQESVCNSSIVGSLVKHHGVLQHAAAVGNGTEEYKRNTSGKYSGTAMNYHITPFINIPVESYTR